VLNTFCTEAIVVADQYLHFKDRWVAFRGRLYWKLFRRR
jgi:hypothetical protein